MENDRFDTRNLSNSLITDPELSSVELQAAFRTAASSIVGLLKAGQHSQAKAYKIGVAAGLREAVGTLQEDADVSSATMNNFINYAENRINGLLDSDTSEDDAPPEPPRPPATLPTSLPLTSTPPVAHSTTRQSSLEFTFTSNPLTMPPTPVTRSQAKRDREHRSFHRSQNPSSSRHNTSGSSRSRSTVLDSESLVLAADAALPLTGMKRRWLPEDFNPMGPSEESSERPFKRMNRR